MDPQIANSYKQFATEPRAYRRVERINSLFCWAYRRLKR